MTFSVVLIRKFLKNGGNAVSGAVFVKQHVHNEKLTDFRGNGALLLGRFVGAADQQKIGILRTGGVGKPGDENQFGLPVLQDFTHFS